MSRPTDPRPLLSAKNSDRLQSALLLCHELQSPELASDTKLVELKQLLARCRKGIDRQNPNHRRQRVEAVNKARNYLHFLPDLKHPEAGGRLRSASRRLRLAMRA